MEGCQKICPRIGTVLGMATSLANFARENGSPKATCTVNGGNIHMDRTKTNQKRLPHHPLGAVRMTVCFRKRLAVTSGSCQESSWTSRKVGRQTGITIQTSNKECDVTASRQWYAVTPTSRKEDVGDTVHGVCDCHQTHSPLTEKTAVRYQDAT